MRIGIGYDVHRLTKNRKLILGGVYIPYEKGLLGHSDADVFTHALMDAILGALGEGDIGVHFPDTDMAYKDISSLVLLEQVVEKMEEKGYVLGNMDGVIAAQNPKINPFIPEMKEVLAKVLRCSSQVLNIKATTTENMGFVGREEGMSAYCVVLLRQKRYNIV